MRRLQGIALFCLMATVATQAQLPPGSGFIKVVPGSTQNEQPATYSDSELDTLLKPLALYPDPLLAQVLPAATRPDQIEAAAQWLASNPQGDIDAQPWDEAVRAVAHYPPVLEMMSKDLAWTEAVGYAYTRQPNEVTASLQRVRGLAYDSGTLVSNEQQVVTRAQNYITILPVSPEVLYVPAYAVADVWTAMPSFWFGYRCGPWLNFGFNWLGGNCYRYPRGRYWGQDFASYNNLTYINNTYHQQAYCPPPPRTNYNQCYRPGRNWDRQPSCNVTNWSQRLPLQRPVANAGSGHHWSRQGQRDYRPGSSSWLSNAPGGRGMSNWHNPSNGKDRDFPGNRPGYQAPSANWNRPGGNWKPSNENNRPDFSKPSRGNDDNKGENRWNRPGYQPPSANWSRPGGNRPGFSLSRPDNENKPGGNWKPSNEDNRPGFSRPSPSYNRPSFSMPSRGSDNKPSFSMPSRSDNRPSFSMPSRGSDNKPSFSMPSRSYNRPSFSMPSRGSDSKPSFSMPSRSYNRPSFSAPSRSYNRPSFSAPTPNFSRPSFSRPSSGGGHFRGGGRRKNK